MDKVLITLMIIMAVIGMISVPFQFNIVQKLKKEGIYSSLFLFFITDLKKYKQLLKAEQNESIINQMKLNYYGAIFTLIIGFLCFLFAILIVII
ncbi:MAG: hypothetical protein IPJ16_08995 [Bacteroidales bacterium]|nr:hypothetical protein [Bacteroidales bacterium]